MTIVVILICIGIQYFLKFRSESYRIDWMTPYCQWMFNKIGLIKQGHGLLGLLILIAPPVLVVTLVFALIYQILGIFGYFVINVALFWYFIDARDLIKEPYTNVTPKNLFVLTYQNLFARLFWYALLGPFGLILYVAVFDLQYALSANMKAPPQHLVSYTNFALGVLDWIPLRLLGLSFALSGHFAATFKVLLPDLLTGIKTDYEQAVSWGKAALHTGNKGLQVTEVISLINRALLIWLIVIALLSIAFWVG